jgi:hypothetical protein
MYCDKLTNEKFWLLISALTGLFLLPADAKILQRLDAESLQVMYFAAT